MRFIEADDIKPTRSPNLYEDEDEPYFEAAIALGEDVVIVCRDDSPEWVVGAPAQLKLVRIFRSWRKTIFAAGNPGEADFIRAELWGRWFEDEIMSALELFACKAFGFERL